MLRQNFGQAGQTARTKYEAGFPKEAHSGDSLRAAYMTLAGQSERVVSGKAIKSVLNRMSSPLYSGREPFAFMDQESLNRKASQPLDAHLPDKKDANDLGKPYLASSNGEGPSERNLSARAFQLPKFLVPPEKPAYSHQGGPRSGGYQAGQTSDLRGTGRSKLPPIPQKLLGDSKSSILEISHPLQNGNQFEKPSLSPRQIDAQPIKPGLIADKKQDHSATPRFASFLIESPAPTFSADEVPVERDADWVDRYQRYESSAWMKLLERPKLLLGILALGIVSCSVYIALGYWWFGSSPVSQAAEPVSMLNVQDDSAAGDQNATSTFNNIHSIQRDAKNKKHPQPKPSTSKTESVLLAQAHPAPSPSPKSAAVTNEPIKTEPTGRPDPFAPLVTTGGSLPDKPGVEEKQDLFSEISYNGFIGDINSPDKVAIIKVNDTTNNTAKTYIKKAGEFISINGERVTVKAISKKNLLMSASGEVRHLPIQQYQSLKPNPPGTGNTAPNGMGGPSTAPSPFGSGSMGGSPSGFSGAPGPSRSGASGGSAGGPNVSLNEPLN